METEDPNSLWQVQTSGYSNLYTYRYTDTPPTAAQLRALMASYFQNRGLIPTNYTFDSTRGDRFVPNGDSYFFSMNGVEGTVTSAWQGT